MAVAGCGSYSKVEGFGFLPINCFVMALTTFISQNLGAKQYDRAKKGARFGILCSISLAEVIGICIYIFAPVLIGAFNNDPQVVAYGVAQAHTITLFPFGLLPLPGSYLQRRRTLYCPHACHAFMLVYHPRVLHYYHCPLYPQDRDDLLGLSTDLVT